MSKTSKRTCPKCGEALTLMKRGEYGHRGVTVTSEAGGWRLSKAGRTITNFNTLADALSSAHDTGQTTGGQ